MKGIVTSALPLINWTFLFSHHVYNIPVSVFWTVSCWSKHEINLYIQQFIHGFLLAVCFCIKIGSLVSGILGNPDLHIFVLNICFGFNLGLKSKKTVDENLCALKVKKMFASAFSLLNCKMMYSLRYESGSLKQMHHGRSKSLMGVKHK